VTSGGRGVWCGGGGRGGGGVLCHSFGILVIGVCMWGF